MSNSFKQTFKIKPIAVSVAIAVIATGCFSDGNNSNNSSPSTQIKDDAYFRDQATKMLSSLSLSEKLDLLSGPGLLNYHQVPAINNINPVPGTVGFINGVLNEKLNIPAVKLDDGPAGVKLPNSMPGVSGTTYTTAWPIGTLLASTWDPELIEKVGEGMGNETKEYGIDFILAPGMNIQRNPLNGRNFEYLSEDPLLTGKIGAAIVNGIESNGVGATIKHYFGNESETNRTNIDVIGDARTLREIYMRGFEIAAKESQPWAVMSPYNKVNGAYVDQRKDAIDNILRDEWGFTGLVMSDWNAGNVSNDPTAAARMIKAGNDLIEPGGQKSDLEASVADGSLSEADIDKSVVNILTQVQKTPSYNRYVFSNSPSLNEHAKLARKAGAEGMVLVKNEDSSLPISKGKKVASFGVGQIATYKGGTGSGNVLSPYTVNIVTGLKNNFTVNSNILSYYNTYFDANKVPHYDPYGPVAYYSYDEPSVTNNLELSTMLSDSAISDDVAVITISRQAGEGEDRKNERGDYLLNDAELDLVNNVSEQFHQQDKKVVVVLNINGVVDTSEWGDKVDSILVAYMGGQETGYQVADILSGAVNPSGKLAQTFPKNYQDNPSAATFPGVDTSGDGVPDEIYLNEGIYVGYRYYSSFNKPVSYPFGYGLSYTTFAIDNLAVTANTLSKGASGSITLTATVTNTGSVAGKEVAQVYINAPEVKLKKPTIELKAFDKTSELDAGASETLTFNIPAKLLASFDPDHNQWIVEPGAYQAYISNSSDVTGVEPISFTVSKEIVVSNTTPGALALPAGVTASDFVTVSEE